MTTLISELRPDVA